MDNPRACHEHLMFFYLKQISLRLEPQMHARTFGAKKNKNSRVAPLGPSPENRWTLGAPCGQQSFAGTRAGRASAASRAQPPPNALAGSELVLGIFPRENPANLYSTFMLKPIEEGHQLSTANQSGGATHE